MKKTRSKTPGQRKQEKMDVENIVGRWYEVTLRSDTGPYSMRLLAHDVCDAAQRVCERQRAPLRAVRTVRVIRAMRGI